MRVRHYILAGFWCHHCPSLVQSTMVMRLGKCSFSDISRRQNSQFFILLAFKIALLTLFDSWTLHASVVMIISSLYINLLCFSVLVSVPCKMFLWWLIRPIFTFRMIYILNIDKDFLVYKSARIGSPPRSLNSWSSSYLCSFPQQGMISLLLDWS